MNKYSLAVVASCLYFLTTGVQAAGERWYDSSQVNQGQGVFQQNCASCHGANAEAKAGWQEASGEASAPPLNGTAHTWHHSLEQLKKTISFGNVQLGGVMPAFGEKLSTRKIEAAVAYFQSKWTDDIYSNWADRFKIQVASNSNQDVTELLKLRLGTDNIAPATETGIEGVFQTQFGDKYAYLIEGGRYVFIGDLVDLKNSQNLTEISRRAIVKDTLATVPVSDSIIYPAQGEEKTVLNVFTDTSCAYCQKLHQEVGYLQQAGISVRYFPFPRGGSRGPGYQDLKSVWCAKDKLEAMSIAKGVVAGELSDGNCANASRVDKGFELGRKIGITGTPALFSSNGTKFNGYVPYNELIPMLLGEL